MTNMSTDVHISVNNIIINAAIYRVTFLSRGKVSMIVRDAQVFCALCCRRCISFSFERATQTNQYSYIWYLFCYNRDDQGLMELKKDTNPKPYEYGDSG